MGCRAGPRRRPWQHATGEGPWREVGAQVAGARDGNREPGSQSLRTERTGVQRGMQGRLGESCRDRVRSGRRREAMDYSTSSITKLGSRMLE